MALAQALADSPSTILQKLAEVMLEIFGADSAGVSLLTKEDGGKRFFWPAIAGVWKRHIGGGTPRDFGPCGDVLDRNSPLLFKHVERRYAYFLPVTPPVEECLLVPFYVEGKAVGTIWAISHDESVSSTTRTCGNFSVSARSHHRPTRRRSRRQLCRTSTAARTNSWRCLATNSAIPSPHS